MMNPNNYHSMGMVPPKQWLSLADHVDPQDMSGGMPNQRLMIHGNTNVAGNVGKRVIVELMYVNYLRP